MEAVSSDQERRRVRSHCRFEISQLHMNIYFCGLNKMDFVVLAPCASCYREVIGKLQLNATATNLTK